ncbi:MAG TPA: T9SS type A sorting domain-containing protein [Ignavibacteria bacterium]|nr:T9SS type A sorting domain-containing protein [Ignavibacteria bacterium]
MNLVKLLIFPVLILSFFVMSQTAQADYPKGAPFISFFESDSSGGPDSLGYTWRDTILTAGTLGFLDTTWGSGTWTRVNGLADDNLVGPFNMGWDFRYYYYNVNQFWVGSNGWISFSLPGNQLASPFPNIPSTAAPQNLIVPYGSDINFQGTGNIGRVYYYTNNVDTFIVSYYNVPFWQQLTPTWTGSNTFQVICTKADSSITFKYLNMTGVTSNNDITVGIENISGLIGLQISRNTYAQNFKQVKIKYPAVVTYQVRDAAVQSIDNPSTGGIFQLAGDSLQINAVVANSGNVNLSAFTARYMIVNSTNLVVATDTVNVPALNQGTNTNVTFNKKFSPLLPGVYSVRVRTLLPGEQVSVNDSTVLEVNVLPKQSNLLLAYESGIPLGGGTSWSGGTGSIGTYFIPPVHPVRIDTVHFYIDANPNLVGFFAQIYDDDGPNGAPGTQLFNQAITNPAAGLIRRVPVTGVNIASGGFYVIWTMNGESIALSSNNIPPISRRSIEGFGGVFGPFREGQLEDPVLRASVYAQTLGVEQTSNIIPERFELSQNYPNPFNPTTKINFAIPKSGLVSLKVYDVLGKEVGVLVNSELTAGSYTIDFNASYLASGLYFYKIQTNGFTDIKKMMLVK